MRHRRARSTTDRPGPWVPRCRARSQAARNSQSNIVGSSYSLRRVDPRLDEPQSRPGEHHRGDGCPRTAHHGGPRPRVPGGLLRLRARGPGAVRRCLPALDARVDLPGGTPIGLPAELPAPLLQLDWCAPFAGPVRRSLHDLKYAGERGWRSRSVRRRPAMGAGRRWRGGRRPGARPRRSREAPRLRSGRAHRRRRRRPAGPSVGRRARAVARDGRAGRAGRDERAANVAGAFAIWRRRRPRPVRSSPAAGSCSSTTW